MVFSKVEWFSHDVPSLRHSYSYIKLYICARNNKNKHLCMHVTYYIYSYKITVSKPRQIQSPTLLDTFGFLSSYL